MRASVLARAVLLSAMCWHLALATIDLTQRNLEPWQNGENFHREDDFHFPGVRVEPIGMAEMSPFGDEVGDHGEHFRPTHQHRMEASMIRLNQEGQLSKIIGSTATWAAASRVSTNAVRPHNFFVALTQLTEGVRLARGHAHDANAKSDTVFGLGFTWAQINPTTVWPYLPIGRLQNGCSGALIAKRVVLTAAHCIFNAATRVWNPMTNLGFVPHQNGSSDPTPPLPASTAFISGNFFNHTAYSPEWDWGIVILQNDAPPSLGYLGFRANTKGNVENAGYPQSKNQEMWHDKCTLGNVPATTGFTSMAVHKCDIEPGSSGSPMFDTGLHVCAIQSGETPTNNYAFVIQTSSFNYIKALILANGGR